MVNRLQRQLEMLLHNYRVLESRLEAAGVSVHQLPVRRAPCPALPPCLCLTLAVCKDGRGQHPAPSLSTHRGAHR